MAHQLAAAAFEQSPVRFRTSILATIFPDELSNILNVKLRGERYWTHFQSESDDHTPSLQT